MPTDSAEDIISKCRAEFVRQERISETDTTDFLVTGPHGPRIYKDMRQYRFNPRQNYHYYNRKVSNRRVILQCAGIGVLLVHIHWLL